MSASPGMVLLSVDVNDPVDLKMTSLARGIAFRGRIIGCTASALCAGAALCSKTIDSLPFIANAEWRKLDAPKVRALWVEMT